MSLSEALRRKRGSGRSTRMMQEAGRRIQMGHRVIILMAKGSDRGFLCAIGRSLGIDITRLEFEIPHAIQERLRQLSELDGVSVFCDHYAIESGYHLLLEEWHRFDGVLPLAAFDGCERVEREWERTADLLEDLVEEIISARKKFPGNQKRFAALIEEVGEVGKAFCEDDEGWANECLQVAAMAIRLAVEGDAAIPLTGGKK